MDDKQKIQILERALDTIAQASHFGWGVLSVVLPFFYGTGYACLGGFVYSLYAFWHEFYWDPHHEIPEVRGSDLKDFVFQIAGVCFGFLYLLAWYMQAPHL